MGVWPTFTVLVVSGLLALCLSWQGALLAVGSTMLVHPALFRTVVDDASVLGYAFFVVVAAGSYRGLQRVDAWLVVVICATALWAWGIAVYAGRPLAGLLIAGGLLTGLAVGVLAPTHVLHKVLMWITVNLALAAALGAYEAFFAQDLLVANPYAPSVGGAPRAAAFTGSVLSLGYGSATGLLLTVWCWPYWKPVTRLGRLVRVACLGALPVGLIASGTAGAWLLGVVGLALKALPLGGRALHRALHRPRRLRVLGLGAAGIVVLAVAFSAQLSARLDRFDAASTVNLERRELWARAAEEIARGPLTGREMNYWHSDPRVPHDSPESWYLLLGREGGLPLLFGVVAIVSALWLRVLASPYAVVGGVIAAGSTWYMVPNFPPVLVVLVVCCVISARSVRERPPESDLADVRTSRRHASALSSAPRPD